MANTYTSLHYYFIFSTKNREPGIVPDIEQRVWPFIGGIVRKHKMTALQVGGVEEANLMPTLRAENGLLTISLTPTASFH